MKPLLVVDGDSLAHRAYHALPKTIKRAGGKQSGAIVGFANFITRLWEAEPDHMRAARAGELHGEPADSAGGAEDQHALAGLEPAVVEQPLPRRQCGKRDGGGLGVAQRLVAHARGQLVASGEVDDTGFEAVAAHRTILGAAWAAAGNVRTDRSRVANCSRPRCSRERTVPMAHPSACAASA